MDCTRAARSRAVAGRSGRGGGAVDVGEGGLVGVGSVVPMGAIGGAPGVAGGAAGSEPHVQAESERARRLARVRTGRCYRVHARHGPSDVRHSLGRHSTWHSASQSTSSRHPSGQWSTHT